jgi:hypothetical protein
VIHLRLVRQPSGPTFTEGELFVNGSLWCLTLEDVVRKGPKVYGETAIPAGKYKVAATFSNRFKKVMTQILDVPGFSGIRIHQGVHPRDSLGCVLVGKRRGGTPGTLTAMKPAVLTDELTRLVKEAGGGEIEVV